MAAAEALNNRHKKETKKKTRKKPIMGKTRARVVSHVAEVTKKKGSVELKRVGEGAARPSKSYRIHSGWARGLHCTKAAVGGRKEKEKKRVHRILLLPYCACWQLLLALLLLLFALSVYHFTIKGCVGTSHKGKQRTLWGS